MKERKKKKVPCCAAERKNHSVDISVQFMGHTWWEVRISRKKGASRGRQEKEAIVTAYVLYCFDARGSCSAVLF